MDEGTRRMSDLLFKALWPQGIPDTVYDRIPLVMRIAETLAVFLYPLPYGKKMDEEEEEEYRRNLDKVLSGGLVHEVTIPKKKADKILEDCLDYGYVVLANDIHYSVQPSSGSDFTKVEIGNFVGNFCVRMLEVFAGDEGRLLTKKSNLVFFNADSDGAINKLATLLCRSVIYGDVFICPYSMYKSQPF